MKKANKKSYSKCKKTLSAILMAAMIMSTAVTGARYIGGGNITVNAVSEEEKTSGDFTYCEQEDGTVKVLRYNANAENNGGKVEIPSEIDGKKVTSVAYGAFASYISEEEVDNREDITSISFPATIKDMPGFDYCPNLTDITVDEGNEYYSSENGVLFNKDKTTLIRVPINSSITDYQIPDSVTTLSGSVFSLCKNLTSVKMPDSVTKIEDGSWFSLFLHCKNLKEVTLSKNITAIGDMMFYGCSSLQSINIPENIESIGDLAFSGCSALKSIDVDENNAVYSSQDGVLFDKDKTKLIKFPAKSDKSEYNIPDSVTVIGDKAFEYCETLTSVTMPDSVSSLDGNDSSTFIGCDKLTDVKLSNNIPVITGRMFYGCSSLKNIKIPDSVTRIYYEAFNGCTSLEIIDVPDSVTSIDGKDVYENTLWYKNQPDGVVYLGKVACAFKGEMLADTTIVLKDGTVGISDDFFFGTDNKITSIVIPDSIKYLDEGAFFGFNGKTIYGIKGSLAENIAYLCDKTFKAVEISEKTFTDEKTNITVKSRVIGDTALYVEQDYNVIKNIKNNKIYKRFY
ncbi:MAG: leucine-rich repeat domain-containing protein [Clostridia bacterium]|nr:leucine-rich repeat domain-containing protein [Clostridia bacterium]